MRSLLICALTPVLLASPLLLARAEKNSVVQICTAPEMNLEEVDRSILDQLGQGAHVNFAIKRSVTASSSNGSATRRTAARTSGFISTPERSNDWRSISSTRS